MDQARLQEKLTLLGLVVARLTEIGAIGAFIARPTGTVWIAMHAIMAVVIGILAMGIMRALNWKKAKHAVAYVLLVLLLATIWQTCILLLRNSSIDLRSFLQAWMFDGILWVLAAAFAVIVAPIAARIQTRARSN